MAEISKEDLVLGGLLSAEGNLTEKGIEMARALLAHVPPLPNIPRKLFPVLMPLTVSVAAELILLREDGSIFLTPREDEFWNGEHVPGSFISPGEKIAMTAQRIANRELGGDISITNAKVIGGVNHPDSPRFHDFSAVVLAKFEGEPDHGRGKWFKEWPMNLIEVHRPFKRIVAPYRRKARKEG